MGAPSKRAALMASTAATAPVVTGAGVQETVILGGRSYTLAAPTLAEVGQFLDEQARQGAPGAAELTEAYREALAAQGEGQDALTAYEEAEDAWVSFTSVHLIQGPDATEAMQAQALEIHGAMLKARRARDRAIVKVAHDPKVLELKARQQAAQWRENCGLVALLLRGWSGPGLPDFPGSVDLETVEKTLPMGDVGALAKTAYALMQPTQAAEKNSAPPSS